MNDIATQRLHHQRVTGEKFDTPEAVVSWMGAVQAQDYGQAVWAIALRTKSATLADVEQAIAGGKILRTWPMRSTIHFVAAADAKWMLQLSAPRMVAADKRRQQQLEIDSQILAHAHDLFSEALSGGRRLSRPVMMQLLNEAGISPTGQRGYHILYYLCQTGLICLGPMENKQQTFALLSDWAPNSRQLDREPALAELANRYLASHGPATVYDFAWWAGLTMADAKFAFQSAKSIPETNSIAADPGVHLLPGYDEYLLGYKDRSAVLDPVHASKIVPGGNGVFRPVIVAGGQVVGTWKRTIKKGAVELTLDPFEPLKQNHSRTGIDALQAAQRYSQFMELPLIAA